MSESDLRKQTEAAIEMDDKYWAEFNRHEETKEKLRVAIELIELFMGYCTDEYAPTPMKKARDFMVKIKDGE